MDIPKKSRTKGELIPAVIFEFHNWSNLWMTEEQYNGEGGYNGLKRSLCIPVGELKKVHHLLLNPQDFPKNDWEP
jgi:hypothetical protein